MLSSALLVDSSSDCYWYYTPSTLDNSKLQERDKSNDNSLIFLTWLYSQGTIFMYLHYSHPLIYHILPNVWKASNTISTSIFVDAPYWVPYSTENFISYILPDPLQWFFHFGTDIVIAWTHIRWVWWMFQNLPLPEVYEACESSGVTPCFVIMNDGVLYHQMSSFSPESW